MGKEKKQYDPNIHGPLLADYSEEVIVFKRNLVKELRKLWKNKEYEKVEQEGQAGIDKLPKEPVGEGDKDIAEIYLLTGSAVWELHKDDNRALELAKKAANFDRNSRGAMWLIREVKNQYSDNSKYYILEVTGEHFAPTKEGVKLLPFKTMYTAVADDPDEAMQFVREFEREEIVDSIELKGVKEAEKEGDLPKGIYSTIGLIVTKNPDKV